MTLQDVMPFLMTSKVSVYIKGVHMFSWEKLSFEQVTVQTPSAKLVHKCRPFFFFFLNRLELSESLSRNFVVDNCSLLLLFIKGKIMKEN